MIRATLLRKCQQSKLSVLIVDDDPIFLRAIGRDFERRFMRAVTAQTPTEALTAARTDGPDIVVIDVLLGDYSGLDLMDDLRPVVPNARFLFVTGNPNVQSAVLAMKLGAIDYIGKPVSVEAILAASVATGAASATDRALLSHVERNHILSVLTACAGNVSEAARRLGLHRKSLQRKLDKLEV